MLFNPISIASNSRHSKMASSRMRVGRRGRLTHTHTHTHICAHAAHAATHRLLVEVAVKVIRLLLVAKADEYHAHNLGARLASQHAHATDGL